MNIFQNDEYQCDLKSAINYMDVSDKTFLVTGATGLIGSFIIDTLLYGNMFLGRNNKVIALSRTKERLIERFSYCNNSEWIDFIAQDICNPLQIAEKVDYIIHAASNADPGTYASYPVETALTNIIGTNNVLDYAKNHLGTRVILTSTMEVYGKNNTIPITEDSVGILDFNEVRSCYPESKRMAENLCKSYHDEYGVWVAVARLGYIYGPTMTNTDNKVIAQFIRKAINKEDIILKSQGSQLRSYCYVSDVAAGIFTILLRGTVSEAYNIATEKSVLTIAEMAELIAKMYEMDVVYQNPDYKESKGYSKPIDMVLDESKLIKLAWNAHYTFEDGIMRTIKILQDFKDING